MDAILNLAAVLKNKNIKFKFKLITNSIKNIPQSFSFLDLVLWSGEKRGLHPTVRRPTQSHFLRPDLNSE
jgi:hypothetical protein